MRQAMLTCGILLVVGTAAVATRDLKRHALEARQKDAALQALVVRLEAQARFYGTLDSERGRADWRASKAVVEHSLGEGESEVQQLGGGQAVVTFKNVLGGGQSLAIRVQYEKGEGKWRGYVSW
jgi:hypothetical protein